VLALRLSKQLEDRLAALAAKTGRTKSYYAKQAIMEFLEAEEDYLLAVARLERQRPGISLEEVERLLDLAS
jgi:RHH-type rel operon transcriptional repressor/antitoxin RelB